MATIKLNSGAFVEIGSDETTGAVVVHTSYGLDEELSPAEAIEIGNALITAATE